jgi:ATP-dependent RNA helicase DeaD
LDRITPAPSRKVNTFIMTETRFSDLTLSEPILLALQEIGYENPTPVQASSIPLVASGRDIMVQSQTGTGKTAAFGIPILEAIEPTRGLKSLVLCPTRELAKQVAEELDRIGRIKQIRTVAVYGGASIEKQVAEMKFAHVVAGTPGRVLDHLKRRTMDLSDLRLLVLDEADEMLSMGFARELEDIMSFIPKARQTLLFSATIPPDIKRYAKRYMNEPEFLSLIEENVASDDVTHQYFMVSGVGRPGDLLKVIKSEEPESAIIFGNTRKDTEIVARYLQKHDIDAEYLNSDLSQRDRERVMKRMKDKNLRFLVATDIAARGIDISQLSHVINYILPESPEVYIHRTGRTGRAGLKGTALSLIGPREIGVYYYLRRIYKVALEERKLPTKAEIELQRSRRSSEKLATQIRSSIDDVNDGELTTDAAKLLERDDALELVSILLQHFRNGGTVAKAMPAVPSAGGVLKDVPKPDRVAPGALPQSLADVASRVAIIRGEFRGVEETKAKAEPTSSKPARAASSTESIEVSTSADLSASETSSPAEAEKPKRTRRPRKPRATETNESTPAVVETAPVKESRPSKDTKQSTQTADSGAVPAPKEPAAKTGGKLSLKERLANRIKSKKNGDTPTPVAKTEAPAAPAVEEAAPKRTRRTAKPKPTVVDTVETPTETPQIGDDGTNENDFDFNTENGSKIFINLGRKDGYNAQRLKDLIADLGGLLPEDIFSASIRPRFSFLMVDEEYVDDLLEAITGERVKGRLLRIERARDDQ